jgi:capsular polysaccharide biosynthesis protein
MKKTAGGRMAQRSQRVYELLLLAYPRSHREAYGAAMAQLFRDQYREAWNESGNWGVFKLWLRTLPDWASTCILERLAGLKERKTMTDKLANLLGFRTSPVATFLRVFALVFLLVVIASVTITFLLPESYASTARILVQTDAAPTIKGVILPRAMADDPFLPLVFQILSPEVLKPVIERLKLNDRWGKRYAHGTVLDSGESLDILKRRVQLSPCRRLGPVGNTQLIAITVYGEDRIEAAQIANAIAESYRDYRQRLQAESSPDSLAEDQKAGAPTLAKVLVQITDTAEPGRAPVKPNKTVNIALGIILGILLAAGAGTGIAGLSFFAAGGRPRKLC